MPDKDNYMSRARDRSTRFRHRSPRRHPIRALAVLAILLGVAGVVVAHVRQPHAFAAAPATTLAHSSSHVLATVPLTGAQNVSWSPSISVQLTQPLRNAAQLPHLTPSVKGRWFWRSTRTIIFHPSERLTPGMNYTISIPEGTRGAAGSATTVHFAVALPSITRLQELLSELDYLPVTFTPSASSGSNALVNEPTTPAAIPLSAQNGLFAWRYSNTPPTLQGLFRPGYWSVLDQGAVMSFEAAHGLRVDGVPSTPVWSTLLNAVARRQVDPLPYRYLLTSKALPERLMVWSNGSIIYTTLVNTGVSGATTPVGTWPVSLRIPSQTMSGTNPNGVHYVDPGIRYIAYFHGSDAVHGYPRASYGFPQSAGCIELPLAAAKIVYGFDPLGTLVTVTAKPLAS